MKITTEHIMNLLKLFQCGLVNGAGQDVNHFCVQQAVHRVMTNDLENPNKSDHPPTWCVQESITSFGIYMNDQGPIWGGTHNRAKGLQRFAIAELGSSKVSAHNFFKKLAIKVAALVSQDREWPKDWQEFSLSNAIIDQFMSYKIPGITRTEQITWLANAAADVLMELGTEGSQFLYLLDEPDKKKREAQAMKLGHKIYAAQWAEIGSSCSCNWGMPVKSKH